MIETRFSACCEKAIQDQRSNNVSLIELIVQINSQSFPVHFPSLDCVFLFRRDAEDSEIVEGIISFGMLDGEEIGRQPVSIDFDGNLRTRLTARVQGLVIPEPGDLEVSLNLEEGQGASWRIEVNNVGEPKIEADQEAAVAAEEIEGANDES